MTKEATEKFGSLYQFGVDYMDNFNNDADAFLVTYRLYKNDIIQNGYSREWEAWKEANQELIIRLYNALNDKGLIPTTPIVSN